MARQLISSGSEFEAMAGYSRAVVDGDLIFLAGTSGFDYAKGTIAEDVAEQTRQCFCNIEDALTKAGASLADVVRAVVYATSRENYAVVARIMAERFRDIRPASTGVIAELGDHRIKVEIEITAKKRNP